MIAVIGLFILMQIYCCIAGWEDAVVFGRKGADSFKWDIHWLFKAENLDVLILIPLVSSCIDTVRIIGALAASPFVYSFWHNGFYYIKRKSIDGAYNGFFSQSTTTTANISFTPIQRTLLLIVGYIIFIAYEIFITSKMASSLFSWDNSFLLR